MSRVSRAIVLLSTLAALGAVARPGPALAQAPPPLPSPALESFPAAARDTVSGAVRTASERPDDPDAVGRLGRVLQAWEQWEAAHQAYARAQALGPDTFDWHYLDAVVLQRLVRHDEAVPRLKSAHAIRPGYLPAAMKLAESLFELGDLDASRAAFEKLVMQPAAEPAALVGLGRIAAREGRHEEAIRVFERAVALFPELGAAHYGLARSYRALGRVVEAAAALERHAAFGARWPALEDPVLGSVAQLRDDARVSLQRGVALADLGDVPGAIAAHEAALARDPSLGQAHANLISLYGRVREWQKVEGHYRAATSLGMDGADPHYDYGVALSFQEQWAEAEGAFRRALQANPLHAPARNNLGGLLERRREYEAAASEYRRALDAQPAFRLARFNLGRMLLALGRPQAAVEQLEKLQEPRDAETPRYLFGLATAYVRAGRRADGLRLAAEAQRLAVEHDQTDFAAAIERELALIK